MRPNIIIFNPDEMRADAVSHLGGAGACTPFLDSMVMQFPSAMPFARTRCVFPAGAVLQQVCIHMSEDIVPWHIF